MPHYVITRNNQGHAFAPNARAADALVFLLRVQGHHSERWSVSNPWARGFVNQALHRQTQLLRPKR